MIDTAGSDLSPAILSGLTVHNGNALGEAGGGAYLYSSYVRIAYCRFENNEAIMGGALNVRDTLLEVIFTTFISNKATKATAGHGGAVRIEGGGGQTSDFVSSVFTDNTATGDGGGIARTGRMNTDVRIFGTEFENNRSGNDLDDEDDVALISPTDNWCATLRSERNESCKGGASERAERACKRSERNVELGSYAQSSPNPPRPPPSFISFFTQCPAGYSSPATTVDNPTSINVQPALPDVHIRIDGHADGANAPEYASSCSVCPFNKFSSTDGGSCSTCAAGKHISDNSTQPHQHDSATDCAVCGAGTYMGKADSSTAADCLSCPSGRYVRRPRLAQLTTDLSRSDHFLFPHSGTSLTTPTMPRSTTR
jgi:predicted outer membrane repeat protein